MSGECIHDFMIQVQVQTNHCIPTSIFMPFIPFIIHPVIHLLRVNWYNGIEFIGKGQTKYMRNILVGRANGLEYVNFQLPVNKCTA